MLGPAFESNSSVQRHNEVRDGPRVGNLQVVGDGLTIGEIREGLSAQDRFARDRAEGRGLIQFRENQLMRIVIFETVDDLPEIGGLCRYAEDEVFLDFLAGSQETGQFCEIGRSLMTVPVVSIKTRSRSCDSSIAFRSPSTVDAVRIGTPMMSA